MIDRSERHFTIRTASEKYELYQFSPPGCAGYRRRICRPPSRSLQALLRRSRASSREAAMDWSDLVELAADPNVTIGSATVNHQALSNLKDAAALREMTMAAPSPRPRCVANSGSRLSLWRSRQLPPRPCGDGGGGGLYQRRHGHPRHRGTGGRTNLRALPRIAWDGRRRSLRIMRVLLSGAASRRSGRRRTPISSNVRARHPAHDRHRWQDPAESRDDIEDRLQQPESRAPENCATDMPSSDTPRPAAGGRWSEEFAGADGHEQMCKM